MFHDFQPTSGYIKEILLGRLAALARCGLLLQTEQRGLSVCLLVTIVSPAKAAEPIVMPFGMLTRVGQKNPVLDEGSDPPYKGVILRGGECRPIVKYRDSLSWAVQKMAEPIEMQFGVLSRVGPRNYY